MSFNIIYPPSLQLLNDPQGNDYVIGYSPTLNKMVRISISALLSGRSIPLWEPDESYDTDFIVEWQLKFWKSKIDDNEGIIPTEGDDWEEVSADETVVTSTPDSLVKTLPKTAHGFAVGNVLTLNGAGVLVKVSDPSADKRIGVVIAVADANTFTMCIGGYVTNLSALVAGSIYYSQSDGTISTSETDMPVLMADSVTSGYMLAGSGSSGSIPTLEEVLTASPDANGNNIVNLADPVNPQDADTMNARDVAITNAINDAINGIKWKKSVKVMTTANITLSGHQTINGVAVVTGDRVFAPNQSLGYNRTIFIVDSGSWSYAQDADSADDLRGATVTVEQGTVNADTTWVQTADNITFGVTTLVWTQLGINVADASETVKGKIEIATQAETHTGTDDVRAITPLKLANEKDATGGIAGLTLFKINFKNALNTFTSFFTNANTAERTYTFQDRNGTVADDTDLALKKAIANASPTTVTTSGSLTINSVSGSLLTLDCANKEESKFKFVGDTTPLSIDLTNCPEGAYCILTIERTTNANMSIRFKNKTYLLSNTQLINNGKDALVVRGRSSGRTVGVLGFYCAAETGAQDNQGSPSTTNLVNNLKFVEDTQL